MRVAQDLLLDPRPAERAQRRRVQALEQRLSSLTMPPPLRRALAAAMSQLREPAGDRGPGAEPAGGARAGEAGGARRPVTPLAAGGSAAARAAILRTERYDPMRAYDAPRHARLEKLVRRDRRGPADARPDTVSTGFASLDRLLGGGLRRQDLVVLAGDVGSGKSALGAGHRDPGRPRRHADAYFSG